MRALASLALVAAACAGLATLAVGAGLATLFGFGWTVAVATAVFLVGTLVAWPTVRPTWVLLPLVAAAVPAVAVAASGVRIDAQTGLVIVAPRTPEQIPSAGYRAGLGDLLVDLRRLEAEPGARVDLRCERASAAPSSRCRTIAASTSTSRTAWATSDRISCADSCRASTGAGRRTVWTPRCSTDGVGARAAGTGDA